MVLGLAEIEQGIKILDPSVIGSIDTVFQL
jgi:hypothetical protein